MSLFITKTLPTQRQNEQKTNTLVKIKINRTLEARAVNPNSS